MARGWGRSEEDLQAEKEQARAQERLGFRSAPLADTLSATLEAHLAAPRVPLDTVMDPDTLWEQVQAQGVASASAPEE